VWFLDFPEADPDSDYPAPTPRQLLYAEHARRELATLKKTLERLTVPQPAPVDPLVVTKTASGGPCSSSESLRCLSMMSASSRLVIHYSLADLPERRGP
jgi:hypothetical protein